MGLQALGCGTGAPRVWAAATVDSREGGKSGASIFLGGLHTDGTRDPSPLPPSALEGALQSMPRRGGYLDPGAVCPSRCAS